jgi:hypothetical protein
LTRTFRHVARRFGHEHGYVRLIVAEADMDPLPDLQAQKLNEIVAPGES